MKPALSLHYTTYMIANIVDSGFSMMEAILQDFKEYLKEPWDEVQYTQSFTELSSLVIQGSLLRNKIEVYIFVVEFALSLFDINIHVKVFYPD